MNTPRSQENLVGSLISNRYRITGYISSGGMGSVFEAADTRLADKVVAVKVLHQGLIGDKDVVEVLLRRFEEEAKLSAILGGHSCIIQVTDYGVENAQPYLIMEFLGKPPRSNSLTNLLKDGPLPPERVVSISAQVCDALYYAHTINTTIGERRITGVVHRDIKPSNIFVIKEGGIGERIKVLDFGIAKAMSDMTIALGTNMGFIGTLSHASPEQLRGEVLDARSDIYSFGVLLYQMLTGNLPLSPKTETLPGWYQAHNYESPIALENVALPQRIPERLSQVVFACLEKDPKKRPANMQILGDLLRESLKTDPSQELLKTDSSQDSLKTDPLVQAAKPPIGAQMVIEAGRTLPPETPTVVTNPPRKQPPQPILPPTVPADNKWSWKWTFLSATIVTATLLVACFFGLWVSGGFSSSDTTDQQSSVTFLSLVIGTFGGACLSAVVAKLKVTIEIIVGSSIAGMLIGLLIAAYTPEYALASLIVFPLLCAFTGWLGALLGNFVQGKST
jgi:eukaryotic-like serine/threonine-protein kinase